MKFALLRDPDGRILRYLEAPAEDIPATPGWVVYDRPPTWRGEWFNDAVPTKEPRPSLELSAAEAVADGSEAVTVTVPDDALPVALYEDGAPILDDADEPIVWTTAGDHGLGADAPVVVELRPAFPYLVAQVSFT